MRRCSSSLRPLYPSCHLSVASRRALVYVPDREGKCTVLVGWLVLGRKPVSGKMPRIEAKVGYDCPSMLLLHPASRPFSFVASTALQWEGSRAKLRRHLTRLCERLGPRHRGLPARWVREPGRREPLRPPNSPTLRQACQAARSPGGGPGRWRPLEARGT